MFKSDEFKMVINEFKRNHKILLLSVLIMFLLGIMYNVFIENQRSETKYSQTMICYVFDRDNNSNYTANSINNLLHEAVYRNLILNEINQNNQETKMKSIDDIYLFSNHSISNDNNYFKVDAYAKNKYTVVKTLNAYKNVIQKNIKPLLGETRITYVFSDVDKENIKGGLSFKRALIKYFSMSFGIVIIIQLLIIYIKNAYNQYKTIK